MQSVVSSKTVLSKQTVAILDALSSAQYGDDHLCANHRNGPPAEDDFIELCLDDAADKTVGEAILSDIETITCTVSGLTITVNMGVFKHIDNDQTVITADPSDTKFCMVSLVVDDSSKALEVYVFEKTTGAYGSTPAGKTFCCDLKEFSVVAAGDTLVLVQDFIS